MASPGADLLDLVPEERIVAWTRAFVRQPTEQTSSFEDDPHIQRFLGENVGGALDEIGAPWRRGRAGQRAGRARRGTCARHHHGLCDDAPGQPNERRFLGRSDRHGRGSGDPGARRRRAEIVSGRGDRRVRRRAGERGAGARRPRGQRSGRDGHASRRRSDLRRDRRAARVRDRRDRDERARLAREQGTDRRRRHDTRTRQPQQARLGAASTLSAARAGRSTDSMRSTCRNRGIRGSVPPRCAPPRSKSWPKATHTDPGRGAHDLRSSAAARPNRPRTLSTRSSPPSGTSAARTAQGEPQPASSSRRVPAPEKRLSSAGQTFFHPETGPRAGTGPPRPRKVRQPWLHGCGPTCRALGVAPTHVGPGRSRRNARSGRRDASWSATFSSPAPGPNPFAFLAARTRLALTPHVPRT